METLQLVSDAAEMVAGSGVPGIGLIGMFAQNFYNQHLKKRFEDFCTNAEIDNDLIQKIQKNENFSNCFYAVLETVRRTHSKLGLTTLALIYKEHWNDEKVLIPAMRSFAEISDQVLEAFIELYESIPEGQDYVDLYQVEDGDKIFHESYQEGVELINRNIFLQSSYPALHLSGPIQGTKFEHTDLQPFAA